MKKQGKKRAKCKVGEVYDQKLKKCKPARNRQKDARERAEMKQQERRLYTKGMKKRMLDLGGVGDDRVFISE